MPSVAFDSDWGSTPLPAPRRARFAALPEWIKRIGTILITKRQEVAYV